MNEPLRVVIGAGEYNNNPGWLLTQEEELNLLSPETWEKRFTKGTITAILAEHVWEHLTYEEGVLAARNCYDFLKSGGYIRCAVPDAYFQNEKYQRTVQIGGPGPKDHPAANHKIVFNYKLLKQMFNEAGFEVKLLEYCDEEGVFHYNPWDPQEGFIYRSLRFDHRNADGKPQWVSLLVDAIKK
jgi:predicted SAM-dependent methyltransferase